MDPKKIVSPQWRVTLTITGENDAGERPSQTFCTVMARMDEGPATDIGGVTFVPDKRTILVRLNIQHEGVRNAALTGDQERMKDYMALLWAVAAGRWRRQHGEWPWPSANDNWPEFVKVGRMAGEQIGTRLGRVR